MPYATTPLTSWKLDGIGWSSLIVGNTLYIGGQFTTAASPGKKSKLLRCNLAAFNLTTGAPIMTFQADTNGIVRSLATDGTHLFVGGQFAQLNGKAAFNLAAIDLATGALSNLKITANRVVTSLAVSGGALYVGGDFSTLNKVSASGSARFPS